MYLNFESTFVIGASIIYWHANIVKDVIVLSALLRFVDATKDLPELISTPGLYEGVNAIYSEIRFKPN